MMNASKLTTAIVAGLFSVLTAQAQAADSVLIVSHTVKDYASWKRIYDADKGNRDKAGLVERYLLRDVDNPNHVTVVFEASSPDSARDFTRDPALKEAMVKAGVQPPPQIRIANVAN